MKPVDRKGWCPGALRPMQTGDGLLVRLRVANGALPFSLAHEIAAMSERFGNALIDLSARANLQLRGVAETGLEPLWRSLRELDLLDADADAEAVRNVVPSPLAGFDDTAVIDARPVVAALEARLVGERALRALPPKFGFLVDGGGLLSLAGIEVDVAFEAFSSDAGPRLAVRLGGVFAGAIEPSAVPDVARSIARNFCAQRGDDRRMRALIERVGVDAVAHGAGIDLRTQAPAPRKPVQRDDYLGAHVVAAKSFVGAALPFGRLRAADLRLLADGAQAHGAAELRLTPWRAILAPGLEADAAHALTRELIAAGFILDGADPRLALAACAGAPACASAHADVRRDALSLAPLLRDFDGVLHLSGCAKGCAFHAPATLALVATPQGYDLVRNGLARDEPVRRGLTLDEIEIILNRQREGAQV